MKKIKNNKNKRYKMVIQKWLILERDQSETGMIDEPIIKEEWLLLKNNVKPKNDEWIWHIKLLESINIEDRIIEKLTCYL
jgi:hypothetical protein